MIVKSVWTLVYNHLVFVLYTHETKTIHHPIASAVLKCSLMYVLIVSLIVYEIEYLDGSTTFIFSSQYRKYTADHV